MKFLDKLFNFYYTHESQIPELKRKFGIIQIVAAVLISIAVYELFDLIITDNMLKIMLLGALGFFLAMISQSVHFIKKKR